MFLYVCVCVRKLNRVCLCLASVHMHHGMCVSQKEVTHETVALLFFHLLQCSGLSWQGSCGYQSLENKAVRCDQKAERERERLRLREGRRDRKKERPEPKKLGMDEGKRREDMRFDREREEGVRKKKCTIAIYKRK